MAKSEIVFGELSGGGQLSPTILSTGAVARNSTASVSASPNKRYIVVLSMNYTQNSDQSRAAAYVENGVSTQLLNRTSNCPITYNTSTDNISITNGASSTDATYWVFQLD